jgi:hypothetical protein
MTPKASVNLTVDLVGFHVGAGSVLVRRKGKTVLHG